jgi:hypothetical protein
LVSLPGHQIADGYEYSQYQTLRTIELYRNSKFETGNKDSLKREKPFYNICKFRVNVTTRGFWSAATARGIRPCASTGSGAPAIGTTLSPMSPPTCATGSASSMESLIVNKVALC